ncbi:ATP-binding protein [Paracoccus halophilus]|uniref:sensor histidine kinase n=1 Tax=Paracoccus halophilus TaxID=376733 RepID=UPI002F41411B
MKHGAAGQPVQVALSADGALAVRNAGPMVAPEVMAQLAQPFTRGATPAEGSGLGLAIARAIAAGSGGRLALSSPAPGQADGFEARFTPGQSNQ